MIQIFIKNTVLGFYLVLLVSLQVLGQAETSGKALPNAPGRQSTRYNQEFNYGLNFNTNGGLIGGVQLKWAWKISEDVYHAFGLEFVNVKHDKELRFTSPLTGNSFILYKTHYLFPIRSNYTRELALFTKAAEKGVQINLNMGGGVSLGIVKPYHIIYGYGPFAESVPYDPNIHNDASQIQGSGAFLDGFDAARVVPGLHAKTSLSFEFGAFNNNVIGVETGLMVELFTEEIPLMAYSVNRTMFTSAFLTLYYGDKY